VTTIQSLLDSSGYIVADGAMGTMLFAAGLEHGDPPESWNLAHPEQVAAIHRGYLEAGAQILLTNTFGGNRYRLELHGLQHRVAELNCSAVEILRSQIETSGKTALLAGDIGPSGQVLLPYGELDFADAVSCFAEQAAALVNAGADLIWIETMSDLEEMRAATQAVRQVSADIPIIMTMTFDTHGRTMMGVTPEKAVETLRELQAMAIGGNCGNGPDEVITVVSKMRAVDPNAVLVAKANAGIPELVSGRPVYRATPAAMVDYALEVYAAGARIIGACCGSTPEHIHAITNSLAARREAG
jgi:5-methyltetrahydrofolate--homocysteine methyltransferase